jgi:hypothetical protein
MTTIKQISNKEFADMKRRSIKIWHFEKYERGVKPVEGEYNPNNPNHVPYKNVIREKR